MKKTPQLNGYLLAYARKGRGWTQAYVAQQVGVTVDAVRRWEGGTHFPYQKTIHKLCELFQMTPKELGLLKGEERVVDQTEKLASSELVPWQATHLGLTPPAEAANVTMSREISLLQTVEVTWEPNEEEKKAAWEIYVELVTRIPIAPLGADEGVLREALSSLYSLFSLTRAILRNHSPAIAQYHTGNTCSLSYVVVCMLNTTVRPLLAKWHPLLKAYEETRPASIGATAYEQQWERYGELRQEISKVRTQLIAYARIFARIAGVDTLVMGTSEVRPQ